MSSPPLPPPPGGLPPQTAWAPPPPVPYGPAFNYATFWQRVAATLIDGLLLVPIAIPFLIPLMRDVVDEVQRSIDTGAPVDATLFASGRFLGFTLAFGIVQYAYQVVMIGVWGATVGKFALSLRVRRSDGSIATWREAFLRPLLQIAISVVGTVAPTGILSLLDNLWMLWDKQRQTLHDKVASTIVIKL
ncbi:MAG: RDD family protein [Actinomycetota bacterium]